MVSLDVVPQIVDCDDAQNVSSVGRGREVLNGILDINVVLLGVDRLRELRVRGCSDQLLVRERYSGWHPFNTNNVGIGE